MVIRRGDIYWVDFSPGKGSEPLGRRPGLVIQSDALNDSKIKTAFEKKSAVFRKKRWKKWLRV